MKARMTKPDKDYVESAHNMVFPDLSYFVTYSRHAAFFHGAAQGS